VDCCGDLPVTRFLIDVEAVCCDDDGVTNFERLHSRADDASVFLYAFDLLTIDGADIRPKRLDYRRASSAACWPGLTGLDSRSILRVMDRRYSSTPTSLGSKASFANGGIAVPIRPLQGVNQSQEPDSPAMQRLEEVGW
jgi:hypothetical protein